MFRLWHSVTHDAAGLALPHAALAATHAKTAAAGVWGRWPGLIDDWLISRSLSISVASVRLVFRFVLVCANEGSLGLSGALWASVRLYGSGARWNLSGLSGVRWGSLKLSGFLWGFAGLSKVVWGWIRTLPANPYSEHAFVRQTRTRAKSRAQWRPPNQNPNLSANPYSEHAFVRQT